jgi:centrosomal CEP192-like protein/beta-propeller repeat-containing protein
MLRRIVATGFASVSVLLGFLLAFHTPLRRDASVHNSARTQESRAALSKALLALPLSFEPSADPQRLTGDFLARGRNYTLLLSPSQVTFLPNTTVPSKTDSTSITPPTSARMQFAGSNPAAQMEGQDDSGAVSNYFIGRDASKWRTGVPRYNKVRVRNLYEGIDLVYYGKNDALEHDFIVAPGRDPAAINFSFGSGSSMKIDRDGALNVTSSGGTLRLLKPRVYQMNGETQTAVNGQYELRTGNRIGFNVGKYDQSSTLVIDPVVDFSTYFGGSGDDGIQGMTLDSSGNIYIIGNTGSPNFLLVNPFQTTGNPTDCGTPSAPNPCGTPFVAKFNPTASALIFSTYFGGISRTEEAFSLAIDSGENVYVAGLTGATDFPITSGAYSTTYQANPCSHPMCFESFVSKFAPSGSALVYSTYLGAADSSTAIGSNSLAVDGSGHAFVTGSTSSPSFPTTPGAFQTTCAQPSGNCNAVFITEFNTAGSALVYSTYLGGSVAEEPGALSLDSAGRAVVAGFTGSTDFPLVNPYQSTPAQGFVAKVAAGGSGLVFSTYFGVGQSMQLNIRALALDSSDNIYFTGFVDVGELTTTPGSYLPSLPANDSSAFSFASKFNSTASVLEYSTYLAGSATGTDQFNSALAIAVDALGQAYVAGFTQESDYPQVNPLSNPNLTPGTCVNPGQAACAKAFLTLINAQGSALLFSSYFGGSNQDASSAITVDSAQSIYLAGETNSNDFPVVNAFQPTYGGGTCVDGPCSDVFLAKIQIAPIAVAPTSLMFSQNVGSASAAQIVTLSNATAAAVPLNSISANAPFSETDTCAGSVPAASTCTVSVVFTPTTTGPASGSLTITYNTSTTFVVGLSGTGTQPSVMIAPSSLQFGSQAIATPSASQSATLSNQGTGPLNISGITASGDFSQTNTCGASVAPGANCSISVVFTPTAAGSRAGQISISDDASPSPQTIMLTGTGTGPLTMVSPTSLTFASQVLGTISAGQNVTLTNSGSSAVAIGSINITGDFGQTNNCGSMVAAASSCAISVTFSPAGVGARSGTLTVTDNSSASPHLVTLSGTGVGFSLAPGSGGSTSVTVAAGQPGVFTLQVQGQSGFNGTVGLSANCGSVPMASSCMLSAPSVQITGANPVSFTLSVGTTKSSSVSPFWTRREMPPTGELLVRTLTVLCALLVICSLAWRKRFQSSFGIEIGETSGRIQRLALSLALLIIGISLTSCGSGSSGGGGSSGTTPGTYTVTVTASAQGGSQTQNLTLIVQ